MKAVTKGKAMSEYVNDGAPLTESQVSEIEQLLGVKPATVLFDLDGTLITSYMDRDDKNFNDWELLPGSAETVASLTAGGGNVAIVTNQGGVGMGYNTIEQARDKLRKVGAALGFESVALVQWAGDEPTHYSTAIATASAITKRTLYIFVCYAAPRDGDPRRKPSGAMIREAIMLLGSDYDDEAGAFIDREITMVGDRPEDEAAANDAGVPFFWADAFFGRA